MSVVVPLKRGPKPETDWIPVLDALTAHETEMAGRPCHSRCWPCRLIAALDYGRRDSFPLWSDHPVRTVTR